MTTCMGTNSVPAGVALKQTLLELLGIMLLLFICSVVSDSLQPHGLQHFRYSCPSPSPRPCSNSCPLSQWCHPTTSSSVVPFSSCLLWFPALRSFPMSRSLHQVDKVLQLQLQISPFNEYSGLTSFMIDWFDLLAVQGTLKSSPAPQFKIIKSSVLSLLYGSTLTSIHDYWKNQSSDYTDLCWQSNVFAF